MPIGRALSGSPQAATAERQAALGSSPPCTSPKRAAVPGESFYCPPSTTTTRPFALPQPSLYTPTFRSMLLPPCTAPHHLYHKMSQKRTRSTPACVNLRVRCAATSPGTPDISTTAQGGGGGARGQDGVSVTGKVCGAEFSLGLALAGHCCHTASVGTVQREHRCGRRVVRLGGIHVGGRGAAAQGSKLQ